ncbi:MAG: flagellar basal body-associated FliL family protein [Candidatus Kryptoniota bacterium]
MSETVQQAIAQKPAGKSKKMIIIMSVIVLQIAAAYFLIGFLFKHDNSDPQAAAKTLQTNQPALYQRGADPNFDHVYVVKDLVVNPAGTNGLRFLLATIGLEVTSEETVKELEKRDVQIHDSIIEILTSRTLPELDDTGLRDSLKTQIKSEINRDLTSGRVLNVYFSKFIIQ